MLRLAGWCRCGLAILALLGIAQARADIVDVTISVPGLAAAPSVLAFDFFPGGASLGNQVTLSKLTTDGNVASTSTTGDVTGSGPWVFGDLELWNELLVFLNPTGTTLAFSIDTTNVPAEPGGIPDSFSFYILDTNLAPLVLTDEPIGSHALFQFELGGGADGLRVFGPATDATLEFTISAVHTPSTPVPEPSTIWLLAWLGAAVAVRCRGNHAPGRA